MTPHETTSLLDALTLARPWLRHSGALDESLTAVLTYWGQARPRILLLGDYNRGKSTLLNALLGGRVLPMDLVPLTGAAIRIRYGDSLSTTVHFTDGTIQEGAGRGLLETFGVLRTDRSRRTDVADIEVRVPQAFLQSGVELVDLPGTNDQPGQEEFVKLQLLRANLVIFMLNGTDPWTLADKMKTEEWLHQRGIEDVVYVVNYMNLLTDDDAVTLWQYVEDQTRKLQGRASAPLDLVYRVDALPALRAALKGAALPDDLARFRADLVRWITVHAGESPQRRRLTWMAGAQRAGLRPAYDRLTQQRARAQRRLSEEQERYVKAQALQRAIEVSARRLETKGQAAVEKYRAEATVALQQGHYAMWARATLLPAFSPAVQQLTAHCNQAVQSVEAHPVALSVRIPSEVRVALPAAPPSKQTSGAAVAGAVVGGLLTSVIGMPWLGAAVGAGLGGASAQTKWETAMHEYERACAAAYTAAAVEHLRAFAQQLRDHLPVARRIASALEALKPPDTTAVEALTTEYTTLDVLIRLLDEAAQPA